MKKEVVVESFELDHTIVKAPYIRLISEEVGPKEISLPTLIFVSFNRMKTQWIPLVCILLNISWQN